MKLVLCAKCSDVFSLRAEDRFCSCGACGGRHLTAVDVEVWGPKDEFFVIGMSNHSVIDACRDQVTLGDLDRNILHSKAPRGRKVKAFIFPDASKSVSRKHSDLQLA